MGIPLLTIPNAKEACKLAWAAGQIPCLVGVAGIGKSEALKQCAKELSEEKGVSYAHRALFAPLMPPEKIQGLPFRCKENPNVVKTLIDEELWDTVHGSSHGILILDEINRADDDTLKALFVLMSERRTGIFELPEGWALACAMNPQGSEYKVNDITSDPAMRRRLVFIGIQPDAKIWLDYAISEKFHPSVINFVSATPDLLLDVKTREAGRVYANPAGWEKVSKYLVAAETSSEKKTDSWYNVLKYTIAGTIGTNCAAEFVDYIRDEDLLMIPAEVLGHYAKPGSKISHKVGKALDGEGGVGRHDKLMNLIRGVAIHLMSSKPDINEQLTTNFGAFFSDLPEEMRQMFASEMVSRKDGGTPEEKRYYDSFTMRMRNNHQYKNAIKELLTNDKHFKEE